MRWVLDGPLASLDSETTDKRPEYARVLDIALAIRIPGREMDLRQALVNPGVPIPQESIDVHGLTQERIEAEGKPSAEILDLFLGDIALTLRAGIPLVIMNAPYDLTVLECEARRLGLPTLTDRLDGEVAPIIDPCVIDKHAIRYRRRVSETQGPRQLKTLAQVYGVAWHDSEAHGAAYDAMQNLRVLWRMAGWTQRSYAELMAMSVGPFDPPKPMHANDARIFGRLGQMSAMELHNAQIGWYREQTEGLAEYWRLGLHEATNTHDKALEQGDADTAGVAALDMEDLGAKLDSVSYDWPIRNLPEVVPS